MNSPSAARTSYTFAHVAGLFSGATQYLKARLALLSFEAKSAGVRYGIALALALGGLFVAVLGYIFLVMTAVFGIAAAWDWQYAWIAVLGMAAVFHLGGAVALGLIARQRVKAGAFEDTIQELRKDHEWLTQMTRKS